MRPSLLPISVVALLLLLLPFASCYKAPTCSGNSTNKDNYIYIQGFVPATGDTYTSETIVPAATVACEEINSNSSVLGDYELVIDWSDTMVCGRGCGKDSGALYMPVHACMYMYMPVYRKYSYCL